MNRFLDRLRTGGATAVNIKESSYEESTGIDEIMSVNTELESEEALFAGGFTEDKPEDGEDGNPITEL